MKFITKFEFGQIFLCILQKEAKKKVGHHSEWSTINSEICSVISDNNRTKIQPVPNHFRHFAHFVTR